jgi:hypothetical protein
MVMSVTFWEHIKSVDSGVFTRPAKKSGRTLSPDMLALIERVKTIKTADVVYFAAFGGDKPTTVRQSLVRAAKYANVKLAIRTINIDGEDGFAFGLLTADRQWHRKSEPTVK